MYAIRSYYDPIHFGHVDLIHRAAAIFERLVVGVYDHKYPTKSLLFSVDERVAMIEASVGDLEQLRVIPYSGLTVEFARKVGAQVLVRGLRVFSRNNFV